MAVVLALVISTYCLGTSEVPTSAHVDPASRSLLTSKAPETSSSILLRLVSAQNFSPDRNLSSIFFGVNIEADLPFTTEDALYLADTNALTWRYPGGNTAETYNYTSNTNPITGQSEPNSITNFVRLCRIDNCRAILQLPAEIDSPSTDAAYVSFVERSLQFTPSVWEFGNEPALFTNFSRPWSDWNTPGGTNATPETYAAIVPSILSAIRNVDPTTPVDPLAGVGTGAHSDGAWVEAVMAAAGARAQYVSLHSYIETGPAGNNSTFYEPLYGSSYSLPRLLPEITANISLGCPSCRTTSVIISEDGASTGDVNAPYESGFPMAMWDATQSIQAANSALSSIDFFAFQSGNPGSFELSSGPLAPAYFLFKDVTPYLGSTVLNVTLNDSDGGRVQLGGWWGAGNVYSLLIVNLDTSNSAALTIAGSGFPTHGNIEWSLWNGSSVEPLGGATDWLNSTTVPPNTMELVSVYPAGPVSLPAAPTGVFAASSGPTSVRLSFSQPRGPVVNDSLTYGTPTASAPFCDPTGTISTDGSTAGAVLSGLSPVTAYCFGARAWTAAGPGPISAFINLTTGEAAPSNGAGNVFGSLIPYLVVAGISGIAVVAFFVVRRRSRAK